MSTDEDRLLHAMPQQLAAELCAGGAPSQEQVAAVIATAVATTRASTLASVATSMTDASEAYYAYLNPDRNQDGEPA